MVFYVLAVLVQYAIAFGLALLLNAEIRARKFFRVVFLLPFMLSPVAVSWMIGKSMMEYRFGPAPTLARASRLGQPGLLRLALDRPVSHHGDGRLGLDPLHHDHAAGRPAGAAARRCRRPPRSTAPTRWQTFWQITFPLMLPVSVTAIVLRIIFELKLADIVINVTVGRAGRRDRHRVELHLPRIPRPLERRLRHHAGRVLPDHHHHLRDPAAELRQPLDAEVTMQSGCT